MKVTKKSVLIETTNRIGDCLEAGGVCGQVKRYPLGDVIRVTGLTASELSDANADDYCDGYDAITIKQLIEHHLDGVIVRCGNIIQ